MALQVKTVGRTLEKTAWRATAEAESRSPARIRDWTRLWRLRRGPVRDEVLSGSGGPLGALKLPPCWGLDGGSRRRAHIGGSIRSRRFLRRRSAAASSAEVKA